MNNVGNLVDFIFRAVGMAMGVAALVLSILGSADTDTLITLMAIGLFCLGIASLSGAKLAQDDEE